MAILLVAGYIYFSYKQSNDIETQLNLFDQLMSEGDFDKASDRLLKLNDNLSDRYSCYRVIKRAIELGDIDGDYSEFLYLSKIASEHFAGNEDLQAYYVMALIKNGEYITAYNVADEQLVSDEFKPLLAEAVLAFESFQSGNETLTEYIKKRKEPAFYEYISSLLNDKDLMLNSALLWADSGEIDKAYNLIKEYRDEEFQELIALLAYDSGRNSESLLRFLDLPVSDSVKYDNILLIADLFYLKENWSRSRFYYEQAMEINKFASAPYINISSIYMESSNIRQAIYIVEKGISNITSKISELNNELNLEISDEYSSDVSGLTSRLTDKRKSEIQNLKNEYKDLVLLAHHLYKESGSDKDAVVIEDYRRLFPDDVKIELLEMRESNSKAQPELFLARLWYLLNKDIENREVSEFLIWYLLGLENYQDINLVLERNENRHKESHWTGYYRGILAALQGDYKEAKRYFNEQDLEIESWELYYNKGIIEMALNNYPDAMTLFNKSVIAINQMSYLNNRDKYLSKVQTKIAELLIILNDTDEAIRVLNSAFELDPDNYSSDLLKSVHLNLKEND